MLRAGRLQEEHGVGTGAIEPPALASLKGRINENPGCTSASNLLFKACSIPAAEQHEASAQGTHSALRAIELSPVESQHWPKRQS